MEVTSGILMRVKGKYAALWPAIGIVLEVGISVTSFIFLVVNYSLKEINECNDITHSLRC